MVQQVLPNDDLSRLPEAATMDCEEVVNALVKRFERRPQGQPYTNIGTRILVAMNPFEAQEASSDDSAMRYVDDYRDTSNERPELAPHVFKTAEQAYLHMRQTGLNQSLVFMGESGSGKTEQRRLAFRFFSLLRTHSKKDVKLFLRLQQADIVFEAFTNAKTHAHSNASRVGTYTELQFDQRGRAVGVKTLTYLLEKARVTDTPPEERNFHIFYYLANGASTENRVQFGMPADISSFEYLSQPGSNQQRIAGITDIEQFTDLCSAMKHVGLHKRYQRHIFAVLSAILCLGNLNFVYESQDGFDSAVVKNTDLLHQVSKVLGLDPITLETALTNKTQTVGNESCTVYLDAKGASTRRDELSRALYALLFTWVVEFINSRFCREDAERESFIGMLDFPGWHNQRRNSYEQLCNNYANERIQHFMFHQMFEVGNDEYEAEGIRASVPVIDFPDRTPCLDLFMKSKSGLFAIMDRQASEILGKNASIGKKAGAKKKGRKDSIVSASSEFTPGADERMSAFQLLSAFNKYHSGKVGERNEFYHMVDSKNEMNSFTVSHFWGDVSYDIEGFVDKNLDQLSSDFVAVFRGDGTTDSHGSRNDFIAGLFTDKSVATEVHPRNEKAVVQAQALAVPTRAPSMHRSKGKLPASRIKKVGCLATQFNRALSELITTLDETLPWFVVCVRSNDQSKPGWADARKVLSVVRGFALDDGVKRKRVEFAAAMLPTDFCERYGSIIAEYAPHAAKQSDPLAKCLAFKQALGLDDSAMALGTSKVFMDYATWRRIDDPVRSRERGAQIMEDDSNTQAGDEKMGIDVMKSGIANDSTAGVSFNVSNESDAYARALKGRALDNDTRSFYSDDEAYQDIFNKDGFSDILSEGGGFNSGFSDVLSNGDDHERKGSFDRDNDEEDDGVRSKSTVRKVWLVVVRLMTWMVPSKCIACCGKRRRKDEQIAWREKLTLCLFIFWSCAFVIFWICGLGLILCPHQNVYSIQELGGHNNAKDALIAIRGEVFNVKDFTHMNINFDYIVKHNYLGLDLSDIFPLQLSFVCPFANMDPRLATQDKPVLYSEAYYHDQRWWRNPTAEGYNYYQYRLMRIMRENYAQGHIALDPTVLKEQAAGTAKGSTNGQNLARCIINGEIFDLTDYIASNGAPYVVVPDGESNSTSFNRQFLDSNIVDMFEQKKGQDITKQWNDYFGTDANMRNLHYQCLRGAFYVGKVDERKSAKCYAANYLLLAGSIALVSVIFFKFVAALQLSSRREPEPGDRFVLMNVPCYTEGEESLKNTIDSMAKTKYDDKRKLLFIVCDGMIMGSGNDKPTPRIVLDILGVDRDQDTEALSYIALGEGSKQHNMAKVYSGLYEVSGHVVPYLVVVKCGTPQERTRPGNRGKRDSQIMLMGFFNKVHFDLPMTPLELEVYHQIKNVIGVNPSHYEYVLMIDADTVVMPDSLNRMVRSMLHDVKIMGLCGETRLANAKSSWITMMQVYEYFISHHLTKAFESLFGSVTCLPGCFCMYRIRSVEGKPLLISKEVINDYMENNVDTLHKKNLLHLGEDRYLTTLMLKHFPYFKNKFNAEAQCVTNAPDSWKVLMSQRRRWINSTVHNLFELIFLPQMCGFCCFSMRFVVFIDLISTIIMPATMVYLAYLVYQLTNPDSSTSYISLYLLAAIYGMQALIFILKRQWQHIGWMIVYLLAIPFFTFLLPVYSFWHFDDFSWGNTRMVVGESGRKHVYVVDNEKFDTSTIPVRKWSDYEQELMWESGTQSQYGSEVGSRHGGALSVARPGSAVGNYPKSMSGVFNGGPIGSYAHSNTASVYMDGGFGYNSNSAANMTIRNMGMVGNTAPMGMPGVVPGMVAHSGRATPIAGSPPLLQQHHQQQSHAYSGDAYDVMSFAAGGASPQADYTAAFGAAGVAMPPAYDPRTSQMMSAGAPGFGAHMVVPQRAASPAMMGGLPDYFPQNNMAAANPMMYPGGVASPAMGPDGQQYRNVSDEAIASHVANIIATADLMTTSKKLVREQLARDLGLSPEELKARQAFINSCINNELAKRTG
ncbi:chitin synthase-domain-containing protein [Coemansia spiralis]|nr:chitin synthase-domain-containing protein [Coemansia spiralis]